jgi:MSHA biogenesis protein MshN
VSVINQMLKDLDQRQARRGASQQQQTVGEVKKSTKKILILTSLVSIAITLTALFTWQLYQEVKLLKAQKSAAQKAQLLSSSATEKGQQNQSVAANNDVFNDSQNTAAYKANKANVVNTENNITESTSNKDSTTNPSSISANSSALAAASTNPKADNNLTQKTAPSLTISRVQLSPEALAQQKFIKAEQAIARNDITGAEHLFEDILLIFPKHQSARKQLAALWYGRQLYQPAVNLLSQGIVFEPENSEYRFMQGRIYLALDQHQNAFDSLMVLSTTPDIEYQKLLASTAQKLKQYQPTIDAYTLLTRLDPAAGRWWLGLAVAYDSDGQFTQAVDTYRHAVTLANLSESARQFSRQRLEQLGE